MVLGLLRRLEREHKVEHLANDWVMEALHGPCEYLPISLSLSRFGGAS
jgi:hypothetical protein